MKSVGRPAARNHLQSLRKMNGEIPYVPLGRWITIELTGDKQPDEAILSDYILKEDGSPRYD